MNPTTAGTGWASAVGCGAASAALFGSSLWVPPIGFLFCLLAPLPVAVAAHRAGNRSAALAGGAGTVLAGLLGGALAASVYALQFALGGALLGLATRARRRPEVIVGSYAVVATAGFWITVGLLAAGTGESALALLRSTIAQSVEQVAGLILQGEPDPQVVLEVQAWAEQTGAIMARIFPGLFAGLTILAGWANAALLRKWAADGAAPPWTAWRAPEPWIWVLIGAGLVALLLRGTLATVALNLFVGSLVVYFLQGLAVVQHLFVTKGFPKLFRVAAYSLLFLQFPVMLVIAGVGAFDLWLDFRARWTPAPPAEGTHG